MSENEEYLEETKLITEAFGDLFSKLKKARLSRYILFSERCL